LVHVVTPASEINTSEFRNWGSIKLYAN
jgi:hypothetical protein